MLVGYEGLVSLLSFSFNKVFFVSGLWDKIVKFWDVFESKGVKEIIVFFLDGMLICLWKMVLIICFSSICI